MVLRVFISNPNWFFRCGGNLKNFTPNPLQFSAKRYRGHHYRTVDIFDRIAELKVFDLDGRLIDHLRVEKKPAIAN